MSVLVQEARADGGTPAKGGCKRTLRVSVDVSVCVCAPPPLHVLLHFTAKLMVVKEVVKVSCRTDASCRQTVLA